jgi:capsid protein
MAATLEKLKMMDVQEGLELQATQLTTAFAMYIKTQLGVARAKEIFSDPSEDGLGKFLQDHGALQSAYYGDAGVSINGVRIPVLFPDDEVGVINGHQQPNNHEQFKGGLMTQNARAWGLSREVATGDFSQTSYSSARASMQLAWQYTLAKRANIVNKIASHIFRLWFDEGVVRGTISLPPGVDYWPHRGASDYPIMQWLTRCAWLGAGRIVIDEYKQAKANTEIMSTGQGSLQDVLNQDGTDLESVADAMVAERAARMERGLPLPAHLRTDGLLQTAPPLSAQESDLLKTE